MTSITGVIHSWFFQIHWHYICIMPRRKNIHVLVMLPFPLRKQQNHNSKLLRNFALSNKEIAQFQFTFSSQEVTRFGVGSYGVQYSGAKQKG